MHFKSLVRNEDKSDKDGYASSRRIRTGGDDVRARTDDGIDAGCLQWGLIHDEGANLDYRAARVSYAAEGGADAILAQLADALETGLLEDGELWSVQPPEIEGFSFSRINVRKMGGVVIETGTDGPYAGLYSLTQHIEITSEATDPTGNPAPRW